MANFNVYINYDNVLYKVKLADETVALTEEEAKDIVEALVAAEYIAASVVHVRSGKEFFLGIPNAGMSKAVFVSFEGDPPEA